MDAAIVRWLNGGVGRAPVLDAFVEPLVSDFLVPVVGSLVLLGLWFYGGDAERFRNQLVTIVGVSSVGAANGLTTIVNTLVCRQRPYLDHDLTLLFYGPTDCSFPSNATAVGFALATAVFFRHRRLGAALYVLAVLWGVARVYAGVHYPSDVLAGAAVGVLGALVASFVVRSLMVVPRTVLRAFRWVYLA